MKNFRSAVGLELLKEQEDAYRRGMVELIRQFDEQAMIPFIEKHFVHYLETLYEASELDSCLDDLFSFFFPVFPNALPLELKGIAV